MQLDGWLHNCKSMSKVFDTTQRLHGCMSISKVFKATWRLHSCPFPIGHFSFGLVPTDSSEGRFMARKHPPERLREQTCKDPQKQGWMGGNENATQSTRCPKGPPFDARPP
eukprot:691067-Amphidinium_carterae.2